MKSARNDAIRTITNTQITRVPNNSSLNYKAPFSNIGKDVYWYVSGSKRAKNGTDPNRHIAVFGGDVVISGSLHVECCDLTGSFNFDCNALELTGSLEVEGTGEFTAGVATTDITTLEGDPFFVAGSGISFLIAPSGQITVAATATIEWNERLTGAADGTNAIFTLAHTPASSTALMVFVNGVLQEAGVGADFTISVATVTFNNPPAAESKITATYSR